MGKKKKKSGKYIYDGEDYSWALKGLDQEYIDFDRINNDDMRSFVYLNNNAKGYGRNNELTIEDTGLPLNVEVSGEWDSVDTTRIDFNELAENQIYVQEQQSRLHLENKHYYELENNEAEEDEIEDDDLSIMGAITSVGNKDSFQESGKPKHACSFVDNINNAMPDDNTIIIDENDDTDYSSYDDVEFEAGDEDERDEEGLEAYDRVNDNDDRDEDEYIRDSKQDRIAKKLLGSIRTKSMALDCAKDKSIEERISFSKIADSLYAELFTIDIPKSYGKIDFDAKFGKKYKYGQVLQNAISNFEKDYIKNSSEQLILDIQKQNPSINIVNTVQKNKLTNLNDALIKSIRPIAKNWDITITKGKGFNATNQSSKYNYIVLKTEPETNQATRDFLEMIGADIEIYEPLFELAGDDTSLTVVINTGNMPKPCYVETLDGTTLTILDYVFMCDAISLYTEMICGQRANVAALTFDRAHVYELNDNVDDELEAISEINNVLRNSEVRSMACYIPYNMSDQLLQKHVHKLLSDATGLDGMALNTSDYNMESNPMYYDGIRIGRLTIKTIADLVPIRPSYISAYFENANIEKIVDKYPTKNNTSSCKVFSDYIKYLAQNNGSVILAHPYESYDTVTGLLNAAAMETDMVQEINMTLYRTSGDKTTSKIVSSLISAVGNGIDVNVLLEVKARGNEAINEAVGKQLIDAGVNVTFGYRANKVHGKMMTITLTDGNTITHTATGNYNETTARFYTDISLITMDYKYGEDAKMLMSPLFTKYNRITESPVDEPRITRYTGNCIVSSPSALEEVLRNEIDDIANNSQIETNVQPEIVIKANGLDDEWMAIKLFAAANAGAKITLLLRATCVVPDFMYEHKNINIKACFGHYLEHSRIYYFKSNMGREKIYISSADMMSRNLANRVEFLTMIESATDIEKLKTILTMAIDSANYTLLPVTDKIDNPGFKEIKAIMNHSMQSVYVNTSDVINMDSYNEFKNSYIHNDPDDTNDDSNTDDNNIIEDNEEQNDEPDNAEKVDAMNEEDVEIVYEEEPTRYPGKNKKKVKDEKKSKHVIVKGDNNTINITNGVISPLEGDTNIAPISNMTVENPQVIEDINNEINAIKKLVEKNYTTLSILISKSVKHSVQKATEMVKMSHENTKEVVISVRERVAALEETIAEISENKLSESKNIIDRLMQSYQHKQLSAPQ